MSFSIASTDPSAIVADAATYFALALLGTFLLTPVVRAVAAAIGLTDRPDNHRKLHAKPISLGGGVAVLLGFLPVALYAARSDHDEASTSFAYALMASVCVLCVVGLIDDRFALRGRQKLAGQVLAAIIMLRSDIVVDQVSLWGWHLHFGVFAVPFTLFWLLGCINALNLLDGLDGLVSTVGVILAVAIGSMALLQERMLEGMLSLALAGALLGFLCYNRRPASIFLGDAGSMVIGLILGCLALRGSLKAPATVALAAPTAILAIPIFDTTMAIVRRLGTGRSLSAADRSHLHHSLLRYGKTSTSAVIWIGAACAVTCAGALLSVYRRSDSMALVAAAAVVGTFIATRSFGFAECRILMYRISGVLKSIGLVRNPQSSTQTQIHLQGNRDWAPVWRELTAYAEQLDLTSLQLNVNAPKLNEEFHAVWQRNSLAIEDLLWKSEIPLTHDGRKIGRICVSGACRENSPFDWVGELIAGFRPLEAMVTNVLSSAPEKANGAHKAEDAYAGYGPYLELQGAESGHSIPTAGDWTPG